METDPYFHPNRTHCASIADGSPVKIKGKEIRGNAHAARLAIYNILKGPPSEEFELGYLDRVIDDCIKDGVDIISIATATEGNSYTKFLKSVAKGVVVVCCAGNCGPFPGLIVNLCPWVITVAAIKMDKPDINLSKKDLRVRRARQNSPRTSSARCTVARVAKFSSRGPNHEMPSVLKPDIAAPGVDILAAYRDDYVSWSGTSMATSHISGICALVKKAHLDWSPAAIK